MKISKRLFAFIAAAVMLFALLLTGCSDDKSSGAGNNKASSGNGDKTSAASGEPIKIGFLNEASGAYEEWGKQELRGFMVGLDYATGGTMEINGRPIEVIVEDTTGDVGVGVQKATKLLEDDKVDILSGSTLSSIALAVMDKAAELKVPYIVNCAASNDITGANFNEYTFRIGRNLWMASESSLGYLDRTLEKGLKDTTWVLLSPDYAGGRSGSEALAEIISSRGGIVLDYMYPPMDAADFTSYIQKIKQLKPDYVAATLVGNNYTVKFPQQYSELGAAEISTLSTSIVDFDFLAGIGEYGVGMMGECIYHYKLFDTEANKYFVEKHQEMYNGDYPDFWAGQSFAGAQAIVETIKKAGTTDAQTFIETLEGLEYESIKGKMVIRKEDHQALQNMAIARVVLDENNNATVELEDLVQLEDLIPPITVEGRD